MAKSYSSIALVYKTQGMYSDAIENYEKGLDIRRDVQGETHTDVASCYTNIAAVYADKYQYQDALNCYTKALEIRKTLYGDSHPSTRDTKERIAEMERLLMYS